jgi:hypothetical protein
MRGWERGHWRCQGLVERIALAPALTRCLSRTQANVLKTAGIERAPELSRISRGSSSSKAYAPTGCQSNGVNEPARNTLLCHQARAHV